MVQLWFSYHEWCVTCCILFVSVWYCLPVVVFVVLLIRNDELDILPFMLSRSGFHIHVLHAVALPAVS